jgi:DnaK suppressor protein
MNKVEKRRFKAALKAKRQELLLDIARRRESLAVDRTSDPYDQVRLVEERDLSVRDIDRLSRLLIAVDRALGELTKGNFGSCAQCGEDIPMRRLEAVPWSAHCLACQQRVEQSQSGGEQVRLNYSYALAS